MKQALTKRKHGVVKHLLAFGLMVVGMMLMIWLIGPWLGSLTTQGLGEAKQTVNDLAGPLLIVRMCFYAAIIFFMPIMAGVSGERLKNARISAAIVLVLVEVLFIQRLWVL